MLKINLFRKITKTIIILFFGSMLTFYSNGQSNVPEQLYDLGTGLSSRSISFENPTGEPGKGGQAAGRLGVGRKGAASRKIASGEELVLCDIEGSGTIRHIWMTGTFKDNPVAMRSMVIRAYWEGQEHASIECPLGDFMGSAHAKINPYQSAVHSTGIKSALNIWLPMPFDKHAKFTITNEGKEDLRIFYQIDYTINDRHPKQLGRLHVCFMRDNPTTIKEDFEILPKRTGSGRFIGTVLGIRTLEPHWWGEGEIKFFMDGDTEFPTICGTGSEDYVCLSYGMQETPYMYHGCSWNRDGFISMYRWHLPDPIYWQKECRVTIQQIGNKSGLFERSDDWSSATFWYESIPSAPLPKLPDLESRTANLWQPSVE